MLIGTCIVLCLALFVLGPIPVQVPFFNQILGLVLVIGGPLIFGEKS